MMKTKKALFLVLASLGMFACSNENVVNDNGRTPFNDNGVVEVKIVNPFVQGRATQAGFSGDNVEVKGTFTVTLTGVGKDHTSYDQTIEINAENLTDGETLKFWNVVTPEKLTVSVNGGVDDYSTVALADVQQAPAAIPAYGETEEFTLTAETASPTTNNNGTEAGAEEGDEYSTYQKYTATVTMKIPVARLEVGNITHDEHTSEGDDCMYSKLTIDGAYMDGLITAGGNYTGGFITESSALDFSFDGEHGTGDESPLKDAISSADDANNFLTGNSFGVFAYNFYVNGTSNPQFKLYFATAEGENEIVSSPRYAMITRYKSSTTPNEEVIFQPGHIYRVKSATLSDENIIGDEGGETSYAVEVTVEEAVWTAVDIEADWAE